MRRIILAAPLLLALSGCSGLVDSLAGKSGAGSGLAHSQHVQGAYCPDFTVQGSIDVANMSANCTRGADGSVSESFSVGQANASAALAQALTAQAQQTQQVTGALSSVLSAVLPLAMSAATGIPVLPRPAPAPQPAPLPSTTITGQGVTTQP